ncbi:MAG TPA: hypothetical protein PKX00_19025 [Opitutaceae bacterium]|nr:hypothetical protein [Opitutaceae bacterium]HRE07717.1 hypothetical protein [Opitutaceae bacterium]
MNQKDGYERQVFTHVHCQASENACQAIRGALRVLEVQIVGVFRPPRAAGCDEAGS